MVSLDVLVLHASFVSLWRAATYLSCGDSHLAEAGEPGRVAATSAAYSTLAVRKTLNRIILQ